MKHGHARERRLEQLARGRHQGVAAHDTREAASALANVAAREVLHVGDAAVRIELQCRRELEWISRYVEPQVLDRTRVAKAGVANGGSDRRIVDAAGVTESVDRSAELVLDR